jgi:hypothetical protein
MKKLLLLQTKISAIAEDRNSVKKNFPISYHIFSVNASKLINFTGPL